MRHRSSGRHAWLCPVPFQLPPFNPPSLLGHLCLQEGAWGIPTDFLGYLYCMGKHWRIKGSCTLTITVASALVLLPPVLMVVHSNKILGDFCFWLIHLLWSFAVLLPPICSCPVLWQSQHSMLAVRAILLSSPNRFVWMIWAGSSMGYAGQVLLHMVHHTQDPMSLHNVST